MLDRIILVFQNMARDINKSEYTEETKLKLNIFRECFREWYPVFLHNPFISRLYVYDMFAGSGKDSAGNYGSPLILLQEARGDKKQHCEFLNKNKKPSVVFGFNEKKTDKSKALQQNIEEELECCKTGCYNDSCLFATSYKVGSYDFQELIQNKIVCNILANKSYGKFVLLDQYGFKQIDDSVFLKLVNSPKTDFIFFIASSFVKRFHTIPAVSKYFDNNRIKFDEARPKECHRVITNYFRSLIPESKEYYLHSFTIHKGKNYYGLIFGTSHTLGMEKFLKVCWKHDKVAGESNCNINNDFEKGTIFYNPSVSSKKQQISTLIKREILNGNISNNIEGLRYALKNGCEPILFVETVEELLEQKKIVIDGKFNRVSSGIHNAKIYNIVAI